MAEDLNSDNFNNVKMLDSLANTIESLNKKIESEDFQLNEYTTVINTLSTAKDLYKELKEITIYSDVLLVQELQQNVNDFLEDLNTKLEAGFFKGADGYTPIKGQDYNDGQDGYTPQKGIDYNDGQDGYTPQKGVDYNDGQDGYTPQKGVDYNDGQDGLSAYQVALNNGFSGTEFQWLDSLKGQDGYTPIKGQDYNDGQDGLSAYEIAVNDGFNGTESDWLESLKGQAFDNYIFLPSLTFDFQANTPLKIFDFSNLDKNKLYKVVISISGGSPVSFWNCFIYFDYILSSNSFYQYAPTNYIDFNISYYHSSFSKDDVKLSIAYHDKDGSTTGLCVLKMTMPIDISGLILKVSCLEKRGSIMNIVEDKKILNYRRKKEIDEELKKLDFSLIRPLSEGEESRVKEIVDKKKILRDELRLLNDKL